MHNALQKVDSPNQIMDKNTINQVLGIFKLSFASFFVHFATKELYSVEMRYNKMMGGAPL